MTDQQATIIDRLCGPRAFSATSLFVVTPLGAAAGSIQIIGISGIGAGQRAATILITATATCALFLLYSQLHRRAGLRKLPVALVVLGYGSTGLLRALVPALGSALSLLPPSEGLPLRTFQSVLGAIALFSVCAVAFDSLDRQQAAVRELRHQARTLAELRHNARALLRATGSEAAELVSSRLEPLLDDVQERIVTVASRDATEDDLRTLATYLRAESDSTVRPLSKELIAGTPHHAVALTAPPMGHDTSALLPRVSGLASIAVRTTGFRPTTTTALWAILFLGPITVNVGLATAALGLLVASTTSWSLLALGNRLLRVLTRAWPFSVALAVWLFTLAGTGAFAGYICGRIVDLPTSASADQLATASMTVFTVCGLLFSTASAAANQIEVTKRELRTTIATYELEVSGLDQAAASIRRRIGALVHGSIQATFVSNALRIDLAASARQPSLAQRALIEAAGEFEALRSEVTWTQAAPSADLDAQQMVEVVRDKWQGIVDVRIEEPIPKLSGELASVVPEIVQEAVVNAAKHGNATTVWVNVDVLESSIVLKVDDNGTGPRRQAQTDITLTTSMGAADAELSGGRTGATLIVHFPLTLT